MQIHRAANLVVNKRKRVMMVEAFDVKWIRVVFAPAITLREEQITGAKDLLLRHEDVDILELPQHHAPISDFRENRAFVGDRPNPVLLEQLQEAKQFQRPEFPIRRLLVKIRLEGGQSRVRNGFRGASQEGCVDQRRDSPGARRSIESIPIDGVVGESLDANTSVAVR